jgi:phosphatidate cytidylyltransferase
MLVKVTTGVFLAVAAVAGILFAPFAVVAPIAILVFLVAQDEFVRLPGSRVKTCDRVVAAFAGLALMVAAAISPDAICFETLFSVFALGTMAILLVVLFSPHPIDQAADRAGHSVAGFAYVGVMSSLILLVLHDHRGSDGRYVFLLAGAVTWANDTMAYFGGKSFGRHKMYPAVSPNKTWEGSVSGMLGSVVGALLVRAILKPDAALVPVIVFALVGGALGQAGDLVESLFKRAYGVKDSANLLPGHGGLLDRVDAFLFVGPIAFFWFFVWFPL